MHLSTGDIVDDKFRILGHLGVGGMGAVFVAQHIELDRRIALKVLSVHEMDDEEAYARFVREAQIISQLRHSNVVSVYSFGKHRNVPYIAMELVEGTTLSSLLKSNCPLEPDLAWSVITQAASALSYAHSAGVVHRDLKPSNIIISDAGCAKVIDFGLAKIVRSDAMSQQKLTEAGTALGSVLYMSPEQCLGLMVDERSDLYGFACVVFHCLTGSPPYNGDSAVALMYQHVNDPLPPHSVSLGPELLRVLSKALAKDPHKRHHNIADFVAELEPAFRVWENSDARFESSSPAPVKGVPVVAQFGTKAKFFGVMALLFGVIPLVVLSFVLTKQSSPVNELNQEADVRKLDTKAQLQALLREDDADPLEGLKLIVANYELITMSNGTNLDKGTMFEQVRRVRKKAEDLAAEKKEAESVGMTIDAIKVLDRLPPSTLASVLKGQVAITGWGLAPAGISPAQRLVFQQACDGMPRKLEFVDELILSAEKRPDKGEQSKILGIALDIFGKNGPLLDGHRNEHYPYLIRLLDRAEALPDDQLVKRGVTLGKASAARYDDPVIWVDMANFECKYDHAGAYDSVAKAMSALNRGHLNPLQIGRIHMVTAGVFGKAGDFKECSESANRGLVAIKEDQSIEAREVRAALGWYLIPSHPKFEDRIVILNQIAKNESSSNKFRLDGAYLWEYLRAKELARAAPYYKRLLPLILKAQATSDYSETQVFPAALAACKYAQESGDIQTAGRLLAMTRVWGRDPAFSGPGFQSMYREFLQNHARPKTVDAAAKL